MKPDRRLLEQLPDDALLPVAFVRALLDEPATDEEPLADLTAKDAARALGRSASTLRGWCARGELQGAYRLRGREWRIPRSALRQLQDRERENRTTANNRKTFRTGRPVDLGSWRKAASAGDE